MSRRCPRYRPAFLAAVLLALGCAPPAAADAITEWNEQANAIVVDARMEPGTANRTMAILYTATYEAVGAIVGRDPAGASAEAAVAAVHRVVLATTLPAQQAAIEAAYTAALAKLPDGPGRAAGVARGEQAARAVLAARADDGAVAPESYRPHAAPGRYVPTAAVAASHWGQRRPWVLASASQLRPDAPPELTGGTWARDYRETQTMGARSGSGRSPEQTEVARFWEATLPSIYHGVVRSVARQPGRDLARNARLFAAVAQASDDAVIAVFEAKYHYGFWRPLTAIRNGDLDGNDATERDASWLPLIETPMHPEYPCAHCTVAGAVAAVLRAELGAGPTPRLATTSYLLPGVTRSWASLDAFEQEVSEARIHAGVHYRRSNEAGTALGRRVGEAAAAKLMR